MGIGSLDDRVKVEGANAPRRRGFRWRRITAVLIVVVISTVLVLVQRPHLARERADDEAVVISEAFVEAHGNWNYQTAASLVSDTAVISINPALSPEELQMEMAWMQATGWVFTTTGCTVTRGPTGDGTQRVLCYLTHENAWSRALNLDPDTRSSLTFEVASGQIVGAFLSSAPMSFRNDAVRSFETWLGVQHPEDLGEMYRYAGLPSLTLESIELWRRYTDEFVVEQSGAKVPEVIAPAPEVTTTIAATTQPGTGTPDPTVVTLVATPDMEPLLISTVIGDLEFTTLELPADFDFHELAATPYGLVAIGDSSLWWSTDYQTWERIFPDPVFEWRVTVVGDDFVVYGAVGAARYAWDGNGWTEMARLDLPGWISLMAFGPRGAVGVSGTTMFYSTDGVHFTEAARAPDPDVFVAAENVPEEDRDFVDCRATFAASASRIRTVLATDAGFVALTSAAHPDDEGCAPLLWFSADGNTWDLVSSDSPFGELSVVRANDPSGSIAEHDGRFVAIGEVGGQGQEETHGAVWVSDDGLTWQRADMELNTAFTIAAGEMGWMLIGSLGEGNAHMWFSTDGLTWDGPHELPKALEFGWFLPQIAVGSDAILAVGPQKQTLVIGRQQN